MGYLKKIAVGCLVKIWLRYFWVGKPTNEFEASWIKFRNFTDSSVSALINERTQRILSKQFGNLSGVFLSVSVPNTAIDTAWIGIDQKLKTVGGAAGESADISNYSSNYR
jgi:hypothetical protein